MSGLRFIPPVTNWSRCDGDSPMLRSDEKGRLTGRPLKLLVLPLASYLPDAAPAAWGYIDTIFSSKAFMLLPVSSVASTAG